jgi:alanine-glyoxylate transaminase / serine-glyoxylate transaminase / serine-pyruvate transaminase
VHAETSTGVRSDIAALGEALRSSRPDALLVVDAVTSIGGIELCADDWGVDVGYAGTQKCLGVAPGLAPFTINDRAFARRIEHPQSWYLDLGLLGGYVGEASGKGGRTYHHTAPVAMVVSLHAALVRILDEGLPAVWARHAEAGQQLQAGLQEMGLELFAQDGYRLPELTTVRVPDDVDSATVRKVLLERHNIEIGSGAGEFASSVWRIGLMGHNARPDAVLLILAALKEALSR